MTHCPYFWPTIVLSLTLWLVGGIGLLAWLGWFVRQLARVAL